MFSSISPRLVACLKLFTEIFSKCDSIMRPKDDDLLTLVDSIGDIPPLFQQYLPSLSGFLPALQDEYGRLRVWAGNIGAHQSGRASLDYRLRDASHIKDQIIRLLDDLQLSLRE